MPRILIESLEPSERLKRIILSITISKILNTLSLILLFAAIPLTVLIAQNQQELRQRASSPAITPTEPPTTTPSHATTTISIIPQTVNINVGQTINFDIVIDPGSNLVSFVDLYINFDALKFITLNNGFTTNTEAFPGILSGPIYTENSVAVTLTVGADPKKVISSPTKIGTLSLKTLSSTGNTPTKITIGDKTVVLSIASQDKPNDNVLTTTNTSMVSIAGKSLEWCSPCLADVTGNGKVTKSDYASLKSCINKSIKAKCLNRDLNNDGNIDSFDLNCVTRQLGKTCSSRKQNQEVPE